MADWEKYWTMNPKSAGEKEYRIQVEHTLNGLPYDDRQFESMVSGICSCLDLRKDDVLLDLCCGNGVITTELAKKCGKVVGVDFSEPLLKTANRVHRPANVDYHRINVIDSDKMSEILPALSARFNAWSVAVFRKKRVCNAFEYHSAVVG